MTGQAPLSSFKSCTAYYLPDASSSDPVQDAFKEATKYFKESLTQDECKRIWLDGRNSLEDVENVLIDAKQRYESSKSSQARKWLTKFSARVLHYGEIMDTLSQHHPEYVSLVWGAAKFLFIGVMNHEELIAELSRALSNITDALLSVTRNVILFPTKEMKQTIAILYAKIIKFFHRAMCWYKQSKFKHIISSFTRPVALRYKDLISDILEHSGRVDKLASTSAHAELRDVHLQLKELDKTLNVWISKGGFPDQMAIMLDESRKLTSRDISQLEQRLISRLDAERMISTSRHLGTTAQLQDLQWSATMQYLSSNTPTGMDPIICLARCKASYKQLLASGTLAPTRYYSKNLLSRLQLWADSFQSGIICLKGTVLARGISQGLAIELVESLRGKGAPVIWALNSRLKQYKPSPLTTVEILKHLALQIFQINPQIQRTNPVATATLYTARNEEEWFGVIAEALSGMQLLFIVFDLDLLDSTDGSGFDWPQAFTEFFERLRSKRCETILRISFISCKYASLSPFMMSGARKQSMDIVPISSRTQIQNITQSPSRKKKLAVSPRMTRESMKRQVILS